MSLKIPFLTDLRKIHNEKIVLLVKGIIDNLLVYEDIIRIKNLKKLSGFKNAYPIQIQKKPSPSKTSLASHQTGSSVGVLL